MGITLIINNKKSINNIVTLLSINVKKYAITNSIKDINKANNTPEKNYLIGRYWAI